MLNLPIRQSKIKPKKNLFRMTIQMTPFFKARVSLANAIRGSKSNCRQFIFQAVQIQLSITIQIQFQWLRVDDCDFDLISIKFAQFQLNSINFWFKDWLKDLKSQLKDWKKLNLTISDYIRPLSIKINFILI